VTPGYHLGAEGHASFCMKAAFIAGYALNKQLGIFIYQYAHFNPLKT